MGLTWVDARCPRSGPTADYKIENVLIDPASHGITGVIDWDYSQEAGLPLLDLLYLFAYNRTIRTGRPLEEVFIGALLADDYDPLERELYDAYVRGLDLPRRALGWARCHVLGAPFRLSFPGGSAPHRGDASLADRL